MANSSPAPAKWQTDWSKCCLCQKETQEVLKAPPTRYSSDQDGYSMISMNIPLFYEINDLPIILDPARLDEGGGIDGTLRRNKAMYHQSCRLLFNNTKLDRAKKRRAQNSNQGDCQTKMRRAHEGQKSTLACFLCNTEAPASELRQVMTMQLNQRLNECAKALNDGKLLAALSGGDAIAQELKYHVTCLTNLYNRERASLRTIKRRAREQTREQNAYPQAFSELVICIVETKSSSEDLSVFRLADLVNLYQQR